MKLTDEQKAQMNHLRELQHHLGQAGMGRVKLSRIVRVKS